MITDCTVQSAEYWCFYGTRPKLLQWTFKNFFFFFLLSHVTWTCIQTVIGIMQFKSCFAMLICIYTRAKILSFEWFVMIRDVKASVRKSLKKSEIIWNAWKDVLFNAFKVWKGGFVKSKKVGNQRNLWTLTSLNDFHPDWNTEIFLRLFRHANNRKMYCDLQRDADRDN